MKVQELMSRDVECVDPNQTIQNASSRMKDLDVGPLPVCENNRLVGMLTDRDIVVRAVANGADSNAMKVRDAMSPAITYCFEDQEVSEASESMKNKRIRRLVVLNRDKQLVGMLALADLATHHESKTVAEEALAAVSQPVG